MAFRTMCCRAYLDLGVFFMSCTREVQWEAERWCGVRPEVTEAVQALYEGACGRYETAYGLTERFPILNGNTQGCSQSPCRSKMQLRLIQEAVGRLCAVSCLHVLRPACLGRSRPRSGGSPRLPPA